MTDGPEQPYQDRKPKGVTLIAWGLLLLGLANIWRSFGLWRQSDMLLELGIGPDPRLRLAISAAWAVLFGASAVTIWTRKRLAQWLTPGALIFYGLYRLSLIFIASQSANQDIRIIGNLIFYTALILFAGWSLNRPKARQYFSSDN
jgi:hypothetical protein